MFKLLRYIRNYKKEAIMAPLFKMLEACFELFVPVIMAGIVDRGIKHADGPYIWKMCFIMVLLGVLGLVSSLTAQYFAAKAAVGFGTELRRDFYAHINRFSFKELDAIGTSTLVTRMTSDINQVQTGVNLVLRLFLRAPVIVIGAVIMVFTIYPKLAVVVLIAVPLIGICIFFLVRVSIPMYKKVQGALDQMVSLTRQNYNGARVVRAFARQQDEKKAFDQTADELSQKQIRAGNISGLMNPITYVLVNLAIVAILQSGSQFVDQGVMTQGEIIAFINYMTQILLALLALAVLVMSVTKAVASAARVNECFAVMPSFSDNGAVAQEAIAKMPKVAFEHVDFAYADNRELTLSDVTFSAMPGETIGVIGGTGAGKSTMIQLIPRFYEVSSGCIRIDGNDVSDYPFAQLRRKIGIVPQQSVLFSGTIRQNMTWAKEDASDDEIYEALAIAQAKEFVVAKPNQLDEKVLAGGRNFSGGQKQRLAIARALVGKPEILILDDSASALDYATDAALRQALKKQTTDMTVFLISQRAATVRQADRIIVLDDGAVAGIGTHHQLLAGCAVYQEICHSQLSREEVAYR